MNTSGNSFNPLGSAKVEHKHMSVVTAHIYIAPPTCSGSVLCGDGWKRLMNGNGKFHLCSNDKNY